MVPHLEEECAPNCRGAREGWGGEGAPEALENRS